MAPPKGETNAISIGNAPPSPRPVKGRAHERLCTCANAVNKEKRPNKPTDAISTFLRPMLSASRPPISAPKNNPSVLALKKVPN